MRRSFLILLPLAAAACTTQQPTPNLAGDYTCTVTAANRAGSTSQTSSVKQVKDK